MELIVAVDRRWAIGKGEALLFSIPEDLARFRERTLGRAIVYGRTTMATFPEGRPLAGRNNYVLTHDPERIPEPARGFASLPALLEAAGGEERLYVVGGECVYRQLLPLCRTAWVTQVDADGGGDRFFPDLDAAPGWRRAEASEWRRWQGLPFRFCRYEQGRAEGCCAPGDKDWG